MEIRSVDRSAYVKIEHECAAAACATIEDYPIALKVNQTAYGFTGKTGKNDLVCVSISAIETFIIELQELLNIPNTPPAVLTSLGTSNNELQLEVYISESGDIVLINDLIKNYPCLAEAPCSLQSKVSFIINDFGVKDLIKGFKKILG